VEGEGDPFDFNFVFLLQSINTHRNEIAPRSHVIREYFKEWGCGHSVPFYLSFLVKS
jgi:hypothetical protein